MSEIKTRHLQAGRKEIKSRQIAIELMARPAMTEEDPAPVAWLPLAPDLWLPPAVAALDEAAAKEPLFWLLWGDGR